MKHVLKAIRSVINGVYNYIEGKVPTKLSELENDLFYYKQEEIVTLTKDDFTTVYEQDDEGNPTDVVAFQYCQVDSLYEYFTGKDSIGFVARDNNGGGCSHNVEGIAVDDSDNDDYSEESVEGHLIRQYTCFNCGINIMSGFDPTSMEELVFVNAGFVIPTADWHFGDEPEDLKSITLYRVDSKKIPIDYCDTSEIEEEIDNMIDEVYSL